ncbi:P-loop containing nucleoside triphosphate hydrolase protein [Mycena capillaripes]|nr:P-loop containing nucleoside triphosphate hydrolase protein [Mycena capillaripes]
MNGPGNAFTRTHKLTGPKGQDNYLARQGISLTAAQSRALEAAEIGNVYLAGQPGSGKTTVAELVAATRGTVDNPVLFIVPRRLLAEVTRERFRLAEINALVNTPWTLVNRTLPSLRAGQILPAYSAIIVDGFGDPTPDLYASLKGVYRALGGHSPSFFVVGDMRASMARFLFKLEAELKALVPAGSLQPKRDLQLDRSFTTSTQCAQFINEAYLAASGEANLAGSFAGPLPKVIDAKRSNPDGLYNLVAPLIDKYGPENCAILTPTVRFLEKHPLAKVGMGLTLADTEGKVVVANYNQFQGCTRSLVFVFGTEATYFAYFGRKLSQDRCPTAILSALTRAREQLVVVHFSEYGCAQFVQESQCAEKISIEGPTPLQNDLLYVYGPLIPNRLRISDIASDFYNDSRLKELVAENLEIVELVAPLSEREHICPVTSVCTDRGKSLYEEVSDLPCDVFLNAFHEERRSGTCPPASVPTQNTIKDYASRSHLTQRKTALKSHKCNWLAPTLPKALDRLDAQFSKQDILDPEVDLKAFEVEVGKRTFQIRGVVDIVQTTEHGTTLWEIKTVSGLSVQDVIQAAIYGLSYALQMGLDILPRVIVFNVQDGHKKEIRGNIKDVTRLVKQLLGEKYRL